MLSYPNCDLELLHHSLVCVAPSVVLVRAGAAEEPRCHGGGALLVNRLAVPGPKTKNSPRRRKKSTATNRKSPPAASLEKPTYLPPRNPSNSLYSSQFDGFPEISDRKYKASQRNTVETGNNDGLSGNFDGFGKKSPVQSVQKGPHLKNSNPNLPTYLSDRVRYFFFCPPLCVCKIL